MESKKVGLLLIIISIILLILLVAHNYNLSKTTTSIGCNPTRTCVKFSSILTFTNMFIGAISAILSLGFYILYFSKSEKELINKIKNLEKGKKTLSKEDKFNILIKALTNDEQALLKLIREEEGITQTSLRHKTRISKTKLSLILKDLEKKNIIKKEIYGKTNKIYMLDEILSN